MTRFVSGRSCKYVEAAGRFAVSEHGEKESSEKTRFKDLCLESNAFQVYLLLSEIQKLLRNNHDCHRNKQL